VAKRRDNMIRIRAYKPEKSFGFWVFVLTVSLATAYSIGAVFSAPVKPLTDNNVITVRFEGALNDVHR
jgi:hypothetical protein